MSSRWSIPRIAPTVLVVALTACAGAQATLPTCPMQGSGSALSYATTCPFPWNTAHFIAPFESYVGPVYADLKHKVQARATVSTPPVLLPTSGTVVTAIPPPPPAATATPLAVAAPLPQASCVFVTTLLLIAAVPKLWTRGSSTHPLTIKPPALLETSEYAQKVAAANVLLAESDWQLVEPDEEVEGADGEGDRHSESPPRADKTPGLLPVLLLMCGWGLKCLVLFVVLKTAIALQALFNSFKVDAMAPAVLVEEGEEVGREEGGEEHQADDWEQVEEGHEVEEEEEEGEEEGPPTPAETVTMEVAPREAEGETFIVETGPIAVEEQEVVVMQEEEEAEGEEEEGEEEQQQQQQPEQAPILLPRTEALEEAFPTMPMTGCLPFNFQPLANLRQAMSSLTLIVNSFRRRPSTTTSSSNSNKSLRFFSRLSSVAAAVEEEAPVLLEVIAGDDDRDRSESAGLRRLAPTESLSLSVAQLALPVLKEAEEEEEEEEEIVQAQQQATEDGLPRSRSPSEASTVVHSPSAFVAHFHWHARRRCVNVSSDSLSSLAESMASFRGEVRGEGEEEEEECMVEVEEEEEEEEEVLRSFFRVNAPLVTVA